MKEIVPSMAAASALFVHRSGMRELQFPVDQIPASPEA
jgi:hypothetical protein